MPVRKMRVEIFDENGDRYTISFEGHVTREKAVRLLDLVELFSGLPESKHERIRMPRLSKFEKLQWIVKKNFPVLWFSTREIINVYEQELKEPINLSTVSTYLARMVDQGLLTKRGPPNRRKYRAITESYSLQRRFLGVH